MIINYSAITVPYYEITPGELTIDFNIGEGVDMNEPDNPRGAGTSPFDYTAQKPEKSLVAAVDVNELFLSNVDYLESSRIEDYARVFNAAIRLSYGPTALKASFNEIIQRNTSHYSVIVRIRDSKSRDTGNPILAFKSAPESETLLKHDDERTYLFLQQYGSHFIQKISYGYDITFEASVRKESYSREADFKAGLQAAYGAFSGEGSVSMAETQKLVQAGVQIQGRVISGGLTPDVPRNFNSVQSLFDFLSKLANQTITLNRGVYKLFLQSYFSKLTKYPNTQKLFSPFFFSRPKSANGVPVGTIISFNPPNPITPAEVSLHGTDYWVPEGWAVCNGGNGTPDLRDRFIMGCGVDGIGFAGGSISHNHLLELRGDVQRIDSQVSARGTLMHAAEHLPPFVKLVWLMKI
jgi:hypothetical protein